MLCMDPSPTYKSGQSVLHLVLFTCISCDLHNNPGPDVITREVNIKEAEIREGTFSSET